MLIGIFAGAILGGVLGALSPEWAVSMALLGDVFLRLLRMIVIPLTVSSMICGVAALGDVRKFGRVGVYTVGYYLLSSTCALLLGLGIINTLEPGVGVDITGAQAPEGAKDTQFGWGDLVRTLVTPNVFKAAAEGEILPLILFSLAFGAMVSTLGKEGQPVLDLFEGIASVLSGIGMFVVSVLVGLGIHAILTLGLVLTFVARINPLRSVRDLSTALTSAFATASSSATLPLTIDGAETHSKATRFVLPLGATMNMDSSALYEAIAAMFIAQAYGIDLTLQTQALMVFAATLASIGAAGIPEAGAVTMVIVLEAVGLPLEGLGLIIAIDWFLDRFRTAVNVWGDAVGCAVIERFAVDDPTPTTPHSARQVS